MHIRTLIVHPKGSRIELPGKTYEPVTQPDGAQVFEVTNAEHIATLLAITDGFAEYVPGQEPPAPVKPEDVVLTGSSVHPAEIKIGDKTYALGDVVHMAHKRSNLSAAAWNELDDEARHAAIDAELDHLARGEPPPPPSGGRPNFAIMRVPELIAYAAKNLPNLKLSARTPIMVLRTKVAKADAEARVA